MAAADPNEALAVLEPRALRQFTDPDYQGPKIYLAPKAFEDKVRGRGVFYVCMGRLVGRVGWGRRARLYSHQHTTSHPAARSTASFAKGRPRCRKGLRPSAPT